MPDIPTLCSRCGVELADASRFCYFCGAAAIPPTPAAKPGIPPIAKILLVLAGVSLFGVSVSLLIPKKYADRLAPEKSALVASTSPTPFVDRRTPKEIALQEVKLDFQGTLAGFGNVLEMDFTITNPTIYAVKDFQITCKHFAKSGTAIDSNTRTVYDVVPAKGKKKIRNFNMGFINSQTATSSCRIVNLVL